MANLAVLLLSAVCLAATTAHARVFDVVDGHHQWKGINLVSTERPSRGELDLRVAYRGLLAMEMMAAGLGERGIFLREVTNGHSLVRLIYQTRDELVDCDLVRDDDSINTFISKFFKLSAGEDWREAADLRATLRARAGRAANATFHELGNNGELPEEYRELLNFKTLKQMCKVLHREVKDQVKSYNREHHLNMERDIVSENDVDSEQVLPKDAVFEDRGKVWGKRNKRSMFIYPGTNWCGNGNMATSYYDLGENIETDKCCRNHDHCTVTIEGFTNKFNYFNYRFHTLSHCECDDQ